MQKKIPEITLTFVVVRGNSKVAPIVMLNVTNRKTKLPMLNSTLFSLA
jgi:hypothetical protein